MAQFKQMYQRMTPTRLTLIVLALVTGILLGLAFLPSGEAAGAGEATSCLSAECLGTEELPTSISEWAADGRLPDLSPALVIAAPFALVLLILTLGVITSLHNRI